MHFDLKKALTYPFDDPKWIKTVGVIIVLTIIFGVIQELMDFMTNGVQALSTYEMVDDPSFALLAAGSLGLVMFNSLIQTGFQFYYSSYILEDTKNVMEGKENPLPGLGNFGEKFRLMLGMFVVVVVPVSLLLLASSILWLPIVLVIVMSIGNPAMMILAGLGAALLALLGIAFCLFMIFIAIPSMRYIFLKTGSITAAWNYTANIEVVKAGWQRIVVVELISVGLGIIALVMALMTCFLFWIIGPALLFWVQLTYAHMMGETYKQFEDENILKLK